jgi:hypothetical protein
MLQLLSKIKNSIEYLSMRYLIISFSGFRFDHIHRSGCIIVEKGHKNAHLKHVHKFFVQRFPSARFKTCPWTQNFVFMLLYEIPNLGKTISLVFNLNLHLRIWAFFWFLSKEYFLHFLYLWNLIVKFWVKSQWTCECFDQILYKTDYK